MNETTKEYSVTNVEELKISGTDITDNGVSSLRQTPNRGSSYGRDNLTADELKARFDKLPAFIADKLNALIQSLYVGDFPLGSEKKKEKKSISELLDSVGNGNLAAALKLSSDENAKSLVEALSFKADAESVENALKEKSAIKLNGILQSEIDLKDYAKKTELENALKALVGDAPEALDTLHEIVQLLGAEGSDLSKTILGRIAEVKSEAEAANRALSSKAEKTDLDTLRSMVTAGLDRKADKTTVSTELGDLRKRVVNLEHGLTLDPFRVDNDVAYTKTPPEGVLPYARILEVGGRSTVHKNLFDLAKLGGWSEEYNAAGPNANGGVDVWWASAGAGECRYGWNGDLGGFIEEFHLRDFCDVQVGKPYTLSCVSAVGRIVLGYDHDTGAGEAVCEGGQSVTFVMTQKIFDGTICFWLDSDHYDELQETGEYRGSIDQIVLVEGTVAGEHIESAAVTSIDVVGENKLPYPYPLLPNEVTVDGLTITPRADGSILLNGTLEKPGSGNYLSVYLHGNPQEGVALEGSTKNGGVKSTLFLEGGYYYVSPKTVEGATLLLKRSISGGNNNCVKISQSDSYFSEGYVFYLALYRGTTFNNAVLYPYIVKGQVAPETWMPYTCERVEIPEAVRALPGYGMGTETYYNRVVWNDDGTVSYIRAVDDAGNVISPAVATDVTEHFSGSNVIKVGPDTTITAVNERRLPVPFSIKYQLKQYVYE